MIHIKRREQLDFGYELFIAAVSILSVFNMLLAYIPGVDQDAINVVSIINAVLTLLFIYDFRIFRLFRIYKAYRIVKKYGVSYIKSYLSTNRAASALYILVLMVILIIEAGGFLVLQAESASPSANITTAGDAIWWAYVTITTVGYGDRFPVTTAGRLVGIMVMTTGVAVFATFAGLISSKLLASPAKEEEENTPEENIIPFEKQVITGMDEIKSYMSQQESKNQEISARLEHLENTLKTDK